MPTNRHVTIKMAPMVALALVDIQETDSIAQVNT